MVFFVCDACGGSFKKNQVEKHLWSCKRSKSLSCIDCNVVFWGDDYKTHIKCISEDQKYGGKDYKPKVSANKGEMKQNSWIETVQSVIDESNLKPHLVHVMQEILKQPNLPRKQAKFLNFIKNSLKHQNPQVVNDAWIIFSKAQEKFKEQATAAKEAQQKSPSKTGIKEDETEETIPLKQEPEKIENEVNESIETELQNGHSKPKKSKKKKRKMMDNAQDTPDTTQVKEETTVVVKEEIVDETTEVVEEETSGKKKRKKQKKQEVKENILEQVTDNLVSEDLISPILMKSSPINQEEVLDKDESASQKKKKKNKKRKNQLQVIEEEIEMKKPKVNDDDENVSVKESTVIAKRKKNKKSKSKKDEINGEEVSLKEDDKVEEILSETLVKKKKKNKKAVM